MSPIRIGFVGLSSEGWAATASVPPLLSPVLSSKYTITAISTRSESSAKESAKVWSEKTGKHIKAFHGDVSQIINDPDVDLVALSVKTPDHFNSIMPVIEAGKDFFLEWPLGRNLEEARIIADAVKRRGVRGLIGLQGRMSPTVQKVKEILESGKIGKVRSTSIIAYVPTEMGVWGPIISQRMTYVTDPSNGATLLSIANGHLMDHFTLLLGQFASVSAITHQHYATGKIIDASGQPTGETISISGPDSLAFNGILRSGAVVSCHWRGGYNKTPGRKELVWEIDGEDGVISLVGDKPWAAMIQGAVEPKLYVNGELVEVKDDEEQMPFNSFCGKNWLEFAEGPEGMYATTEDAFKLHVLLDAIERSAKEGRRIDL